MDKFDTNKDGEISLEELKAEAINRGYITLKEAESLLWEKHPQPRETMNAVLQECYRATADTHLKILEDSIKKRRKINAMKRPELMACATLM